MTNLICEIIDELGEYPSDEELLKLVIQKIDEITNDEMIVEEAMALLDGYPRMPYTVYEEPEGEIIICLEHYTFNGEGWPTIHKEYYWWDPFECCFELYLTERES